MDTWGMEPKAQDNAQTIDEAIAAAISAHEADSEAHLGAGESLETHRASDVIDHKADSIVTDKLNPDLYTDRTYISMYQSLAGFTGEGFVYDFDLKTILIGSSSAVNDTAFIYLNWPYVNGCYYANNPVLDVSAKFTFGANDSEGYVGIGDRGQDIGSQFAGFKLLNKHLYAYTYSPATGNETAVDLGLITSGVEYKLRVEFYYNTRCDFYLDGALVASITTNLPNASDAFWFFGQITTKTINQPCRIYIGPITYYNNI